MEMKRKGEFIPFEDLQGKFYTRVTNIGHMHMLAMMSSWTNPEYVSRVWCLFELFTASQSEDECKVTIEMPSRERKAFLDGLFNGDVFVRIKRNFYVLSSTNVKTAKASVEPDRTDILKLVQAKSGYDKFNIAIDSLIRQWVIRFIEDTAPSRWEDMFDGGYDKDCAILHCRLGLLFRRLGEYDLAIKMYNVELKMVEKDFGSDHIGMYYPLNNIAFVLKMQGKYEDALNTYIEAMAIGEKELECNALDVTLVLEHNMGHVYYRLQREYDKAIGALNRALAIRKEKLELDHVHTADTLGNIASVLRAQGKHQEAMEKYQQLMPFYEKEYGSNSVSESVCAAAEQYCPHFGKTRQIRGRHGKVQALFGHSREDTWNEPSPHSQSTHATTLKSWPGK